MRNSCGFVMGYCMTRSADCWQNRLLVLLTLCLLLAYYALGTAGTVHWMLLAFVLLLPWALRYGDLRTAQLLLISCPRLRFHSSSINARRC